MYIYVCIIYYVCVNINAYITINCNDYDLTVLMRLRIHVCIYLSTLSIISLLLCVKRKIIIKKLTYALIQHVTTFGNLYTSRYFINFFYVGIYFVQNETKVCLLKLIHVQTSTSSYIYRKCKKKLGLEYYFNQCKNNSYVGSQQLKLGRKNVCAADDLYKKKLIYLKMA